MVPAWFTDALAVPFTDERVTVEGALVHYLAWGHRGRRGIVFIHGGGANAHWWTHVAARFAADYRVIAVDLSGHGDSDHRDEYVLEQWTREVMAAVADAGIAGPPVIVGHSMGGFVTIATAALHSKELAGVIVCDSPVMEPDPEVGAFHLQAAFGKPRVYATADEMVARYRTVPPQDHYLPFVLDHVARRSIKAVDGGFTWKFDRAIFSQFGGTMRGIALPYLETLTCRFALLRSECGLVTKDIGASMYDKLGRVAPVIELPLAGHHAMLDEPLILLTALRTLLADWDHSDPHLRA